MFIEHIEKDSMLADPLINGLHLRYFHEHVAHMVSF